jgi:hypothetical protein
MVALALTMEEEVVAILLKEAVTATAARGVDAVKAVAVAAEAQHL